MAQISARRQEAGLPTPPIPNTHHKEDTKQQEDESTKLWQNVGSAGMTAVQSDHVITAAKPPAEASTPTPEPVHEPIAPAAKVAEVVESVKVTEEKLLLVAVCTSPSHHAHRDAIRKTWSTLARHFS